MANIDPEVFYSDEHQADLKARYEAVHAVILAGDNGTLQLDIDSGHVWTLGPGGHDYAHLWLGRGAVVAPPDPQTDPGTGQEIPAYWQIGPDGRGSVDRAENWFVCLKAEAEALRKDLAGPYDAAQ